MSTSVKGIEGDQVLSAAVSKGVEDALEAALRNAFEIALEIAVNEINRLMTRALNDVRDQMDETQQENTTLKLRLQQIRQDNPKQITADAKQSGIKSGSVCGKQKSDECNRVETNSELINESSYERLRENSTSNINENDTSDPTEEFKRDHIQHVQSNDQEPLLLQTVFEQVHVKKEEPEPEEPVLDGGSGSGCDVRPDCCFDQRSNEEFGLDKIDLVQSKLLEDWRPDSEHQHSTPDINLQSIDCVSQFSTATEGFYQSPDKTILTYPPQNCKGQVMTNFKSSLYCKCCGHAFCSESDLRNHTIQYHKTILKNVGKGANATRSKKRKCQRLPPGSSTFFCSICNQVFKRMENLKNHLRIHTGERPYSCSVCGVRFRHSGGLKRHFRIHTGEKPYVCPECGRSFRNCGGLRVHQKTHSKTVHSLRK